jgi:S-adenosylmethionine synthetase
MGLVSSHPKIIARAGDAHKVQDQGRRVLITGASGLLGRQVFKELESGGWTVRGLCSSRCADKLVKCDLTANGQFENQLKEFRPDIVIHLAAERRPDQVHKHKEAANKLNVDVTAAIATACKQDRWHTTSICR